MSCVLVNLNRTLLFESFQSSLATYRHCSNEIFPDYNAACKRPRLASYAHTQAELNKVAKRLNQRPRKNLGYRTPGDTLNDSVALKA